MSHSTNKSSISDYLYKLWKWKKFLTLNLLIVALIMVGLSFLVPNTYKSSAVVMISPEFSSGLGNLTNLIGGKSAGTSITSRLLGGSSASEDMIFGILNSRTALISAINNFSLMEYYGVNDNNIDRVLKAFVNDLSFDLNDNNFIEINVVNKDPKKCADIANYFIYVLDSLNNKLNSEGARNNRIFIEKRYQKNIIDLKKAEDSLFQFQKKYGLIAVPEQLQLLYKAAAEIEAQLFQKQIMMEFIEKQFGENSPQQQNLKNEISILQEKIKQLKHSSDVGKSSNVFLPFKELPYISVNYLEIYREIEIQGKILEVVLPMYEHAKVEENKNIPSVIVIDHAYVPTLKYRPQRSFIVLSGIFFCLFILIPLVFRMEAILTKNTLNNPFEEKELKLYNLISKIYKIII